MSWFRHRHWWIREDSHNIAGEKGGGGGIASVLVFEECRCGAVRTIQYAPGSPPVVHVVEPRG